MASGAGILLFDGPLAHAATDATGGINLSLTALTPGLLQISLSPVRDPIKPDELGVMAEPSAPPLVPYGPVQARMTAWGRHNIQESRFVQPSKKRFTVQRITGSGDFWVTEFVLAYDGIPSFAVSIMEFREAPVARETQYFADRFAPAPSRAHLVERADKIPSF